MVFQTPLQLLETILSLARQGQAEIDPVPCYVEMTFRKYLECGVPSYGFARPAFSAERLDRWDGDTWVYRLKHPLASGETSLVLSPLEILSRLAALVPPPAS